MSEPASDQVYRIDRGRVAKGKRTAQGFYTADATLGLSRVLEYRRADGTIRREWCPDSEAGKPESIETLDGVSVTLLHPPEMVTPDNVSRYQVGITQRPTYDAATKRIRAKLLIQDKKAIEAVERGDAVEMSLGYFCKLDETPGTTPEGEPYDAIQKGRVYNHNAMGPDLWARSGPGARFDGQQGLGDAPIAHLDDAGNCVWPSHDPATTPVAQKDTTMVKHRIDGVDCEFASEAAAQVALKAISERDTKIQALEASESKARTDSAAATSAVQAKLDAVTKETDGLKAELAEARDPKKRAAEAAMAAKLDQDCRRLAPAVKLDGLEEPVAKQRAALAAAKINLTGKDDAYVAARFDAELERLPKRDAADRKIAGARAPAGGHDPETVEVEKPVARQDAYQAMRAEQARRNATRPGQPRASANEEV